MSGAQAGLAGLNFAADKLFDKIPAKAFTSDFYIPGRSTSRRGSGQDSNSSDNNDNGNGKDKDRDIDNGESRRGPGSAAGGSSVSPREAPDGPRGSRDRDRDIAPPPPISRPKPRRLRSNSVPTWSSSRQPRAIPEEISEPSEPEFDYKRSTGYNPPQYSQGDPNFARRIKKQKDRGVTPIDTKGRDYDGPADVPRGQYWLDEDKRQASPAMSQNPYYPPSAASANNFHRYDPRDYQPSGEYQPPRDNDVSNYNIGPSNGNEPYSRPASTGGSRRYNDDRNGGRQRRSDKDRDSGPKERRNKSRQRQRSPSRSVSPGGPGAMVKKRFDMSEKALIPSAIGAIAGGILGSEVGHSPLATVAGVLLGGLGANAWEKRDARKKEDSSARSRSRSRSRGASRREKDQRRRARSEGRRSRDDRGYNDRGYDDGARRLEDGDGRDRRQSYYANDPRSPGNPYGPNAGYNSAYGGGNRSSVNGGQGQDRGQDRDRGGQSQRGGGGGGGGGGREGGKDSDEDSIHTDDFSGPDSKGRGPHRRAVKARKKRAREKREQEEEAKEFADMGWGDILHT